MLKLVHLSLINIVGRLHKELWAFGLATEQMLSNYVLPMRTLLIPTSVNMPKCYHNAQTEGTLTATLAVVAVNIFLYASYKSHLIK